MRTHSRTLKLINSKDLVSFQRLERQLTNRIIIPGHWQTCGNPPFHSTRSKDTEKRENIRDAVQFRFVIVEADTEDISCQLGSLIHSTLVVAT